MSLKHQQLAKVFFLVIENWFNMIDVYALKITDYMHSPNQEANLRRFIKD